MGAARAEAQGPIKMGERRVEAAAVQRAHPRHDRGDEVVRVGLGRRQRYGEAPVVVLDSLHPRDPAGRHDRRVAGGELQRTARVAGAALDVVWAERRPPHGGTMLDGPGSMSQDAGIGRVERQRLAQEHICRCVPGGGFGKNAGAGLQVCRRRHCCVAAPA